MKVWINEYLTKAKLSPQRFKRDGNKIVRLVLVFKNKDEIYIDLTENDLTTLVKELPKE